MANMGYVGDIFSSLKGRHLHSVINCRSGFAAPSWADVGLAVIFPHDHVKHGSFTAKDYKHVKWLQHVDNISYYPKV